MVRDLAGSYAPSVPASLFVVPQILSESDDDEEREQRMEKRRVRASE